MRSSWWAAKPRRGLAQLLRVYNQIIKAPANSGQTISPADRTITRNLCKSVMTDVEAALVANQQLSQNITGPQAKALANKYPLLFALSGDMLVSAAPPQTPVTVDPICDAPLTATTAKLVLNQIISEIHHGRCRHRQGVHSRLREHGLGRQSVPQRCRDTLDGLPDAITTYNGLVADAQKFGGGGTAYTGKAAISGLNQTFSIVGAEATFPIGPLALVLEIQGTGTWGINGSIDYGFSYDLLNSRKTLNASPVTADATASLVPYAGVDADLFVGIGIDIGIGGASVGWTATSRSCASACRLVEASA